MIQDSAGNQPSIVSNGGYMEGIYNPPSSDSTTNSNLKYMRITGTNKFASNDLTTNKVGMLAVVHDLRVGLQAIHLYIQLWVILEVFKVFQLVVLVFKKVVTIKRLKIIELVMLKVK